MNTPSKSGQGQPGLERSAQADVKDAKAGDMTAFELLRALEEQASCPICHLTQQMVSKYLDWIAYESVSDLDIRARLRRALGYCSAHGQAWLQQSDTLATAMIYNDVFTQVRDILRGPLAALESKTPGTSPTADTLVGKLRAVLPGSRSGHETGRAIATALRPQEACPACLYSLNIEQRLVGAFAGATGAADFMSAYERHQVGLCLPHLRAVLVAVPDRAILRRLLRSYDTRLEKTCAELEEVIRKYDYRYTSEPHGSEFGAPARSVGQAGGLLPTQINPGTHSRRP
jgi:hypothetical protein